MTKLALPTGNIRANRFGSYPEVVKLIVNDDVRELGDSVNMFLCDQQPDAPAFVKGMATDAAVQIAYEVEDLIDEIIVHQPKCDSCTTHVKCVEHFRGQRQGCIATEFDTLFLGQFESNRNH